MRVAVELTVRHWHVSFSAVLKRKEKDVVRKIYEDKLQKRRGKSDKGNVTKEIRNRFKTGQ